MTRFQKYKEYRKQINECSQLVNIGSLDDENLKKYKKAIDEINSSILMKIKQEDLNFQKSIVEFYPNNDAFSHEIIEAFKNLNSINSTLDNDPNFSLLNNLDNISILEKNTKKIKLSWLNKHEDWRHLTEIIDNFQKTKPDDNFSKNLYEKFSNLNNISPIETNIVSVLPQSKTNKFNQYIFAIVMVAIGIFFVVLVVLLIIRFVL